MAVLQRLAEQEVLRRDETIVAYIMGNRLTTPDAVAGTLPEPLSVAPSVEVVAAVVRVECIVFSDEFIPEPWPGQALGWAGTPSSVAGVAV